MINYLDWLLEHQEDSRGESDETAAELLHPAQHTIVKQMAAQADSDKAAALRQAAEAGVQAEETFNESAESVWEPAVSAAVPTARPQTGEILSAMLYFQNNALGHNASRTWASELYRESVTAAQAAVTLRQGGSRVLSVSEPAAIAPALSAAQLDELFARDARRYDGGFSMY